MKTLLASLVLALMAGLAYGHGEAKHDRAAAAAATAKEQTDWGIAGEAREVSRTIVLRMSDAMRFSPDRIQVKRGETVRFVLKNDGRVLHELVIGTKAVLEQHAALMKKFPDMEHDEPWMAHVLPGKTGEIVWRFNRAGEFDFACLIPGHYEAGMVGRIVVKS